MQRMEKQGQDVASKDSLPPLAMNALQSLARLPNNSSDLQAYHHSLFQAVNECFNVKNCYLLYRDSESNRYLPSFFVEDEHVLDHQVISKSIDHVEFKYSFAHHLILRKNFWEVEEQMLGELKKKNINPYLERNFDTWFGIALQEQGKVFGCLVIYGMQGEIKYRSAIKQFLTCLSYYLTSAWVIKNLNMSLGEEKSRCNKLLNDLERQTQLRKKEVSAVNKVLEQQIVDRIQVEEKLKHDAFHDPLTDLPNRTLFLDRLSHCIKAQRRVGANEFAVLYLDLDRFKIINDSLGHAFGDDLLKFVSARLLTCVRPGDTVARVGGDEFCIVLTNITSANDIHDVAARILEVFKSPFRINDNNIISSTSIGITTSEHGYTNAEDAIRDADAALYQAKRDGRNCYALFDDSMHRRVTRRLSIENSLRLALTNNEISVDFQPVIDFESQKIILLESLARWEKGELGRVSPDEFIPIAEEIGLIAEIGDVVMHQSMKSLRSWMDTYPKLSHLGISINLSSAQFNVDSLADSVLTSIRRYQIPPQNLYIEITEGLLINCFERAKRILTTLHNAGIHIMLDDFGTGYSSLSYLHYFPIDIIKIDRSFVSTIDKPKNRQIVHSIKTLAQDLNMKVIAEGIETKEQADYLKSIHCEYAQGYFYSRPIKEPEVATYLAELIGKKAEDNS